METTYQAPKLVASQLRVSASGLRRLAAIYESVHGPLPKDAMGGRLWSTAAVARLQSAKALVDAGRVKSVREALERPAEQFNAEVAELPSEINTHELVARLFQKVDELHREVMNLKERQLEAQTGSTEREVELERMNAYLLGELQRRRSEVEQPQHRPWWRLWRR